MSLNHNIDYSEEKYQQQFVDLSNQVPISYKSRLQDLNAVHPSTNDYSGPL